MKMEIEVPDRVFQKMVDWLKEYEHTTVTIDELKANPKVAEFIRNDLEIMYWDDFEDGLENLSLCEELGIKPGEEDDEDD